MSKETVKSCTAFNGHQRVASGDLINVARKVKAVIDQDEQASILIFDDDLGELAEVDFRGTVKDVIQRLETQKAAGKAADAASDNHQPAQRGPGRPRLGVVSREVTLLPRHWDWLSRQPGGASVALRKLVEKARRVNRSKDKVRHSQEAAYRFMSAMAGDFPGFEEASRALFAGDSERFNRWVDSWPIDVRDHARTLAAAAFHPVNS